MKILAKGGEALSAPENTLTAYWCALAQGAHGLVLAIESTQDNHLICSNEPNTKKTCDIDKIIQQTTLEELLQLDAGSQFYSKKLNKNFQLENNLGEDRPWKSQNNHDRLNIATLSETLQWFARRTKIYLQLPETTNQSLIDLLVKELTQFGCLNSTFILLPCQLLKNNRLKKSINHYFKHAQLLVNVDNIETCYEILNQGYNNIQINYEQLNDSAIEQLNTNQTLKELWITSTTMPFGLTPEAFLQINKINLFTGVNFLSAEPSRQLKVGKALIMSDDFSGQNINQTKWSAGYSHQNQDTTISQDNQLIIAIKEGGSYSGAAAVSLLSFNGDIDAQVDFWVKHPHQGTTFEMAAITHDPGYFNIDNAKLNSRTVNLTFDVHGAPPYASSECDENDGFRCGWNNGFNLTKVDPNYQAASVNMYNKYGRDVGPKAQPGTHGCLRLVRHGAYFAAYYQDPINHAWVCSGTMLVNNMSQDCRIRLAAKHWKKKNPQPPGNEIHFNNFKIFQWNTAFKN